MSTVGYFFYGQLRGIAEDYFLDDTSDFQDGDADPEILYNSYTFNKLIHILGEMGSTCEEIEEILTNKVPAIELYVKNDESLMIQFIEHKVLIQQFLMSFNSMKSKCEGIVAAPKQRGVMVALDMTNKFYQEAFNIQRPPGGCIRLSMENINSIFREMESKNVAEEYKDIVKRLSALNALPKDGRLNALPEDLTSTSEYTIVFHSPLSLLEAKLMDMFDNDRTTLRHPIEGVATAKRIIKCAGYLTSLSAHPGMLQR